MINAEKEIFSISDYKIHSRHGPPTSNIRFQIENLLIGWSGEQSQKFSYGSEYNLYSNDIKFSQVELNNKPIKIKLNMKIPKIQFGKLMK